MFFICYTYKKQDGFNYTYSNTHFISKTTEDIVAFIDYYCRACFIWGERIYNEKNILFQHYIYM